MGIISLLFNDSIHTSLYDHSNMQYQALAHMLHYLTHTFICALAHEANVHLHIIFKMFCPLTSKGTFTLSALL